MAFGAGLKHYMIVLRRWMWLLIIIPLLSTGVTFAFNTNATPIYEASAMIQVHDTRTSNGSVFTEQALAQSYALLVNRADVLKIVDEKLPQITQKDLIGSVSASPLNNTPIIEVRAKATKPELAAKIANSVVEAFIKLQVEDTTNQLRGVLNKLAKDLEDAKQKVENDEKKLEDLRTADAAPSLIKRQNEMLNGDQLNYNSLQMSYTQIQQQLLQVSNALTFVQPATAPSEAVSPRTLFNTLAVAALSFLLVLVLVMILDWLDTSLKTVEDVENLAHLPGLGSIPKCVPTEGSQANTPLVNSEQLEQAFIGISTNLLINTINKQTIVVTSLREKAGTSTVAVNLAAALANAGLRVLLIDANIQKAALHHVFKRNNANGLTTLLADNALFKEGQIGKIATWLNGYKTQVPNLWFLPSGSPTPQWTALVRSPIIPHVLQTLLYADQTGIDDAHIGLVDVILFDTPPLEQSNDTVALASFVDSSILVVKAGIEQAVQVQKAEAILKRLSAPIAGVVVNRQERKHRSYYYAARYELSNQEQIVVKEGAVRPFAVPATTAQIKEYAGQGAAPFLPSSDQGVLIAASQESASKKSSSGQFWPVSKSTNGQKR